MARRLLACGCAVKVFDLDPAVVDGLVKRGASATGSPAEAAAGAGFTLTSLPRDSNVLAAISGPGGLLEGLAPGTVHVETSTISPQTIVELADDIAGAGAAVVDAPVVTSQLRDRHRPIPDDIGGASVAQQSATAGNLGFFVGGDRDAFERAEPLLDVLGVDRHHVGPLGTGHLLKLINNAIVGTEVALVSELIVAARRSGLDAGKAVEVLRNSSADSAVLGSHIARYTVPDEFPEGGFPVDYMIKDLRLALQAAAERDVDCKLVATALGRFERAAELGLGGTYNAAVIRAVEADSVA
jgi:3-hydroxyisobutyrate dehydrogenase-like beta-hydroxyacid dehydrogenase